MEPLMEYCEFFETEDEAIEHCREVNRGLASTDPGCCAVVDGPEEQLLGGRPETARDLLDDGYSGLTCLIVT